MNSFGIISIILLLPLQCWTKSSFLSKNFIDSINRKQTTWIAGRNFPEDTPIESLKYLAGTLGFHPDPNFEPPTKVRKLENVAIPDTFDARTEWPECKDIIGKIRNQGNCGSCWAFASAEIMTDSLCIKSNGTVKFEFSPEDLISCCAECGNCVGGYTGKALNYWVKTGVVSGGDYNSGEGCKPYSESTFLDNITPTCKQQCENSNYTIPYSDDKAFGTDYYLVKRNQKDIQAEIMLNGPVLAGYVVYTDFLNYKTGVYQHVSGVKVGGHAVKIIGWGKENEIPYWLVANSWGAEWGNLNGFFKILRGNNECDIETSVFAGEAKFGTSDSKSLVRHSACAFTILVMFWLGKFFFV